MSRETIPTATGLTWWSARDAAVSSRYATMPPSPAVRVSRQAAPAHSTKARRSATPRTAADPRRSNHDRLGSPQGSLRRRRGARAAQHQRPDPGPHRRPHQPPRPDPPRRRARHRRPGRRRHAPRHLGLRLRQAACRCACIAAPSRADGAGRQADRAGGNSARGWYCHRRFRPGTRHSPSIHQSARRKLRNPHRHHGLAAAVRQHAAAAAGPGRGISNL